MFFIRCFGPFSLQNKSNLEIFVSSELMGGIYLPSGGGGGWYTLLAGHYQVPKLRDFNMTISSCSGNSES